MLNVATFLKTAVKESCVRKSEGLERSKLLGILQTNLWRFCCVSVAYTITLNWQNNGVICSEWQQEKVK